MNEHDLSHRYPLSQFGERSVGHFEQGTYPSYYLGVKLEVASVAMEFSDAGSSVLDEIVAFDLAETQGSYLGQLNLSRASSFCAAPPQGQLLGYDVLRPKNGFSHHELFPGGEVRYGEKCAEVFSVDALCQVTQIFFGTRENPVYPIKPGSHTIAAYRSLEKKGPTHLYSALGIAIPEYRGTHRETESAILLMEDVGELVYAGGEEDVALLKTTILHNIAKSCLKISENHPGVSYQSLFVGLKDQLIGEEMGCALVALPYFAMARSAVPESDAGNLQRMTIEEWDHWRVMDPYDI